METRKINEDYRKIALHLIDTEAELEYKSRYKELHELLQKEVNKHDF